MNRIRSLLGAACALVLAAALLSGCGTREDPAVVAQYPHEHTFPVQHPGGGGECRGTVSVRTADPGWRQWPIGVPQLRLDAPEGEPRWYTIVNATCFSHAETKKHNPDLPWSLEEAIAGLGEDCAAPQPVEMPGWEAVLCPGFRQHGAFVSEVLAINDDHYLVLRASTRAEAEAGEGTDPESLEQASPMLRAGEELLLHARPSL